MIFHSLDFIIFLVTILSIYWLIPWRAQNILLLVGSYFFYGYIHPWFLILLFISTVVDFFGGILIDRFPNRAKQTLMATLAFNLGVLFLFKYFNFFSENISAIFEKLGLSYPTHIMEVILPVGISFYTFQSMSYSIDVYKKNIKPTTDFLTYALFVSFFPQLVAGPIERASHLLPQCLNKRHWNWEKGEIAFVRILVGFFKKMVIADNVGIIANKIFALEHANFSLLWAGVFAFSIQIFADFSGYSDIARGCARLFGFELMKNFNHPYFSISFKEFWQRWHISLSSWFRDYLYIPLGGRHHHHARNIMLTFTVSGLWHGASWNFVLWGLLHGIYLLSEVKLQLEQYLPKVIRFILVFVGVQLAWLFFREQSIETLLSNLRLNPFNETHLQIQQSIFLLLTVLLFGLPLALEGYIETRHRSILSFYWVRLLIASICFIGIIVLKSNQTLDFIYFQF